MSQNPPGVKIRHWLIYFFSTFDPIWSFLQGEPTRGSIVFFRSEPAELSKTSGLEEENEEEEEGKRDDHEEKKTLDEEEKKETEKMREKDVTIDIQDSPPSMTPEWVEGRKR